MEEKNCQGCNGTGKRYQIDGQLGGDLLKERPKGAFSMEMACPTCKGTGKINNSMSTTTTHGGRRKNAGRKPLDPEKGKRVPVQITMRPDLWERWKNTPVKDRPGILDKAMEQNF